MFNHSYVGANIQTLSRTSNVVGLKDYKLQGSLHINCITLTSHSVHAFIYSVCEGLVLAPLIVICELSNAAQAMEFHYIYSSVENFNCLHLRRLWPMGDSRVFRLAPRGSYVHTE